MKTFLGLDVGTTSLKAAIFDETGKRLGFRAVDYTLDTDPVTGTIEFDAETYIVMCERVIAELSKEITGGLKIVFIERFEEALKEALV